jgi:pyrroloquinoline quinone biosynthesis protein B
LVLPGGDLDQILGLILLRESQPLRVYSTRSIRKIIMENNVMFAMVRDQVTWPELIPGRECELTSVSGASSGIQCLAFALAGNFPYYVNSELASSLVREEALVGLRLMTPSGSSLVYLPAAPSVEESWYPLVEGCNLLLFDGTFWTDDELIKVRGAGRTARQMGHLPISGEGGSLERLARLKRPRKIYIHINNTNPMLDEDSLEYHRVRAAGWEVAQDGLEVDL